ncbi:hypothetical protein Q8A67_019338 [Cirrhinus molitorella]|uniref:asparaginase n=1 Tax=Cirrhinus molitorella TaxID=172907 RepID=A0AA88THU7_9TELE|nr:hypothetical protein Q8A67_019338 [Cirrhinus molitorella]
MSVCNNQDVDATVLVIYTGGTIGMTYRTQVLSPVKNALVETLRKLPFLHDEQYAQQTGLYDKDTLVVPSTHLLSKQNKRIVYTLKEYSPLLDSCNMTADDWATIGKDIEEHYDDYNGFVILHGTDTMAYTASALSFMCENLGKPVILTGSQVPIFQPRSDGRDNFLGALLIAGQFDIPEVCLYFHHKLYRGNRVTKVDAESFNAFLSPNLPPLANAEVDIKINWDTVWKANTTTKFTFNAEMNRNVGVLRLFPGITADTVRAFLQPPMDGIVLETYGSGNAPDNPDDLLNEIRNATERGLIMINCTRCLRGTVTTSYATGQALSKAGVVAGFDMTSEAAFSKLSYVLAKQELSTEEKKKMLSSNLRGEMVANPGGAEHFLSDSHLIEGITWSVRSFEFLNISCKEQLEDALKPSLACAAARIRDIDALEALRKMGTDLSKADYDGRTPLHIATCEGYENVVRYLLDKGATAYAKDRFGDTPLYNAIRLRHTNVMKLLKRRGVHFSQEEVESVKNTLYSLAARGDLEELKTWESAGIELIRCNYVPKLIIVAKAAGHRDFADYLKQATLCQTQQKDVQESGCCNMS